MSSSSPSWKQATVQFNYHISFAGNPSSLRPLPAIRVLKTLIERLATCEYIPEHRNFFIADATGSGKIYLACAFRTEACKRRYKTKYVRLPDLLLELEMARNDSTYKIFCSQYDSNGWYDPLGEDDSPLAEAILDRIKYNAYKINIIPTDPANRRSMREVYGLDPSLSE